MTINRFRHKIMLYPYSPWELRTEPRAFWSLFLSTPSPHTGIVLIKKKRFTFKLEDDFGTVIIVSVIFILSTGKMLLMLSVALLQQLLPIY